MQKFQIDAGTWATLNRLLDEALEQPAARARRSGSTIWRRSSTRSSRGCASCSRAPAQIETGEFLHTLPKFELEPGDLAAAPARAEQPGRRSGPIGWCASSAAAAWVWCGSPSAPTASSIGRSR